MSISISNKLSPITNIPNGIANTLTITNASDILNEKINDFIAELDKQLASDAGEKCNDAHYNHACKLLKECIEIAEGPERISRIRESVNQFNNREKTYPRYRGKNRLLRNLIQNNQCSLAHLLCDLEINEIYDYNSFPLNAAMFKGSVEMVSHIQQVLNKKKYNPTSSLDLGISQNQYACVKQLLLGGANPFVLDPTECRSCTPFETVAFDKNCLRMLSLFLNPNICHFKAPIQSTISKLLSRGIWLEHESTREYCDFNKLLARALPPLIKGIPCFTPYVSSSVREKIIKAYLEPLIAPPSFISDWISPLLAFIEREVRENSRFAIFFNLGSTTTSISGEYCDKTDSITLYANVASLEEISDVHDTTLLHELCHKICDKLGWLTLPLELVEAATKDSEFLKLNYRLCHPIVKERLTNFNYHDENNRIEEFLVRTIEIIYKIADENPKRSRKEIVKILEENIPNLLNFYIEEFLPALRLLSSKRG